jgi:hypothetical protein
MYLLDGQSAGNDAARTFGDVGVYEGLLNFDLFRRQFKDAIVIDLIADLTEEVGNLPGGFGRAGWTGCWRLLRVAIAGHQRAQADRECEQGAARS